MNPLERSFRISFLIAWLMFGWFADGWTGLWAMFVIFTVCYWTWWLVSEGWKSLKRNFGTQPTYHLDQKILNMNVEPGAIKGTPFDDGEFHRDPTRPGYWENP